MTVFEIRRVVRYSGGVWSVFLDDGEPFALILERESTLIPPGEYIGKPTTYIKGGYETYEITGVINRTRILLHKGNFPEDSAGCGLVGESFGLLKGRTALLSSQDGFTEFLQRARASGGSPDIKIIVREMA